MAFSCCCTNSARERSSVVLVTSRCTVGFEIPDSATSCFACLGSYGVQGTFAAAYQAVFDGGIGVQLNCGIPLENVLSMRFRSSASSNACRSFALVASAVPLFAYGGLPAPLPF